MSMLETLHQLTHAFDQAEREEIGRWFGIEWAALRYQGTASMEGLEFLYPFLNDSDKNVRRYALRAAGKIFRGTGADSLDKLVYITANRDLAIRDRSSIVVGSALAGEPADVIIEVLRPSYTHPNHFIRSHGCVALGLAASGNAYEELLPIFEERMADDNDFVRLGAVEGLAEAFADSGNTEALDLLAPFASFPSFEIAEGEPHREWHFRFRRYACMHSAAASAIARIGRHARSRERALDLLRQYVRPENVPSKMGFEKQLTQRQGIGAACWLLRGNPEHALHEMRDLLALAKADEPVWSRRLPRSAAIFTLPGTFAGSGAGGIDLALELMDTTEHATLRCGILALGVAVGGTGDQKVLAALKPCLNHGNGAVRDAADLALGLAFKGSGSDDACEALRSANLDDRRGPGTNYPLGMGLLFQGAGDERAAEGLTKLLDLDRRRLTRYAALGISLVYQGTGDARAAELLMPVLESKECVHACFALPLVDFDESQLAVHARSHCLADGPGAAHGFVLTHFIDATLPHFEAWNQWL